MVDLFQAYVPRKPEDLIAQSTSNLLYLKLLESKEQDLQHLLFHGPNGCGKKTRIRMFLSRLCKLERLECKDADLYLADANINIDMQESPVHIEVNVDDWEPKNQAPILFNVMEYLNKRCFVVQKLLPFEVLVIHNAQRLTQKTQRALLMPMEQFASRIRIVMSTNSLANMLLPLRSRMQTVRVPLPMPKELLGFLRKINREQQFGISEEMLTNIVALSKRNITMALFRLQENVMDKFPSEDRCVKIAHLILKKVANIKLIREEFYNLLLQSSMPITHIFKEILSYVVVALEDNDLRANECIQIAAHYEHQFVLDKRHVMVALESFATALMRCLSKPQKILQDEDDVVMHRPQDLPEYNESLFDIISKSGFV